MTRLAFLVAGLALLGGVAVGCSKTPDVATPTVVNGVDKKGWIEDRRPNANMDPYVVTNLIVDTCCEALAKLS